MVATKNYLSYYILFFSSSFLRFVLIVYIEDATVAMLAEQTLNVIMPAMKFFAPLTSVVNMVSMSFWILSSSLVSFAKAASISRCIANSSLVSFVIIANCSTSVCISDFASAGDAPVNSDTPATKDKIVFLTALEA